MATTISNLMTADEFYDWSQRPENRELNVELERGEIVEMPPPGKRHGFVCGNVARLLGNYAASKQTGYVCANDAGLLVGTDPDTIRGPDVMYYIDETTFETMEVKFSDHPPALAIEVMSPSDSVNRVVRRVAELIDAGVSLVWVVDPATRNVSVYRDGRSPQLVEETDVLTGEDVIKGFQCKVAEFFAMPGGN